MTAIDSGEARSRLPRRPEDDRERRVERPYQAGERITAEVGVLGHACGYERVRYLEEERGAPAEQQEGLAVRPARDRIAREDADLRHTSSVTLLRSFGFALAGIGHLLRTQRNFRIEVAIGGVTVAAAALSGFEAWEWAVLVLTIALVLVLEAVNTAIENAVTLASPAFDEHARAAKDVSAAAALFAALAAVAVGMLLFGRRLVAG